MRPLTEKQLAFVEAYMVSLNATEAAIKAGYAAKPAKQIGYNLLHKPMYAHVQAEIERRKAERAEKAGVSAEEVVEELRRIGFSRITDVVSFGPQAGLYRQDGEGSLEEVEAGGAVTVKDSDGLSPDVIAAIESVSETKEGLKIKMHAKVPALTKLGEHLGMFVKKMDVKVAFSHEEALKALEEPADDGPA